jgi:hypothetical protein
VFETSVFAAMNRTSSCGKTLASRSKMPMTPSMRAMGTGKYLGGNPVNLRRGRAWQDMAKERQVNKKI